MLKKVLVTGAAGFIASHLIEKLLSKNIYVIGIDNFDSYYEKSIKETNLKSLQKIGGSSFSFHEIDITNKKDLFSICEPIDCVFHLAAKAGVRPSIKDPSAYINTNINGTQNILDFMLKNSVKNLLFASSSSIYGNNKSIPFKEEDIVDFPISPYAFTKKTNELQIHTYHKLYQINSICLRLFTVYGPRQRPDLAIHKFFNKILQDNPIEKYGDGMTKRDYTYIEDIIDGIIGGLEYIKKNNNVFEIINLGNNNPISLNEMVDTIYKVLKKEKKIITLPMQPGDVNITYADISKAKKLINYNPKISFKEGIEKFAKWYN